MKRLQSLVHWAGLFAVTKLWVEGGEWQLDVDGEGGRGQEVMSPDKRPYGAVKTTGLGPRKPELKLGSTPSSLVTLYKFHPLWPSEPANISMFIPADFCFDIPSLPPPEKPRWHPS